MHIGELDQWQAESRSFACAGLGKGDEILVAPKDTRDDLFLYGSGLLKTHVFDGMEQLREQTGFVECHKYSLSVNLILGQG
jgi:hypothetical protein